MMRRLLAATLALVLFAGGLLASEAVVVSYDKETMNLVVKEGDKERTLKLKKSTHIHDVDGSELKVKDRPEKLKKGVKIDIEEEKGKIVEINIKK